MSDDSFEFIRAKQILGKVLLPSEIRYINNIVAIKLANFVIGIVEQGESLVKRSQGFDKEVDVRVERRISVVNHEMKKLEERRTLLEARDKERAESVDWLTARNRDLEAQLKKLQPKK